MNFEVTNEILEKINLYIQNADIKIISEENRDFKDGKYQSDFVTIDEENNVGFEVLDNEIIAFYFTDHYHFEDYTSELKDGEDNYKKRASAFLKDLFESSIKKVNIFKGKKLASEEYYMVSSDAAEKFISGTYWSLFRSINPFFKKKEEITVWQFDRQKGIFVKQ